jgi:hypothetical protein
MPSRFHRKAQYVAWLTELGSSLGPHPLSRNSEGPEIATAAGLQSAARSLHRCW